FSSLSSLHLSTILSYTTLFRSNAFGNKKFNMFFYCIKFHFTILMKWCCHCRNKSKLSFCQFCLSFLFTKVFYFAIVTLHYLYCMFKTLFYYFSFRYLLFFILLIHFIHLFYT